MEQIFVLVPVCKTEEDRYVIGKDNVWSNWCTMQRVFDECYSEEIKIKVYSTMILHGAVRKCMELDIMDFCPKSN